MTDNMKKLLELVSQNEELAKKLNGLGKEELIAAAKDLGFELTDADFERNTELSDDELDAVAGGKTCVCVLAGGGEKSQNDDLCICVGGGIGTTIDNVDRCACVLGGGGAST